MSSLADQVQALPVVDGHELSVIEMRRFVNQSLFEAAQSFAGSNAHLYQFVCECDDLRCRSLVMLSRESYPCFEPGSIRAHA
jgi:hypothetical protein